MGRRMSAVALVTLSALGATAVAVAEPDGKQGAHKMALYERVDATDPNAPGDGDRVGQAVLKTTADGHLDVKVHIRDANIGPTTQVLDVWVKVNQSTGYRPPVVEFEANRRGIGRVHTVLDLAEYDVQPADEAVAVQVVVKLRTENPYYWVGYATATESVPLRKHGLHVGRGLVLGGG